jgi:hypothetical protein
VRSMCDVQLGMLGGSTWVAAAEAGTLGCWQEARHLAGRWSSPTGCGCFDSTRWLGPVAILNLEFEV